MKKIIKLTIYIVVLVVAFYIAKDNSDLIASKIMYFNKKYFMKEIKQNLNDNEFKKATNYEFVKIYNSTIIKNKTDLKNAIYTFLDSGWDKYTIACTADYLNCTSDAKELVGNKTELTDISNFVNPLNTFEKINTKIYSIGKITFTKESRYTNDEAQKVKNKIDEIYKNNYDSSKNITDNIRIFHDYIINNTKYDIENDDLSNNSKASTAYGVLFENKGICSGYSDTMALLLDKMKVKNYRISSDSHMWNLVYIEGAWKHLDLTWDDPVVENDSEKNILSDKYFLIDAETLKNYNDNEHNFDESIYVEAK